ncbi:sensor histidine kinase [Saccharothrix sp. Mg75]|uniref:sensor histidine kinase n=1 Tax=Saccharothrix sp. Mg75 TaxID=3445357 RepID=UPI003EED3437
MVWSRLVVGVAAACLVVAAIGQWRVGGLEGSHPRNWFVAVSCCLLGVRVVSHAPRNAVGWVVLAMGFAGALAIGSGAVGNGALGGDWALGGDDTGGDGTGGDRTGGEVTGGEGVVGWAWQGWALWLGNWVWWPGYSLLPVVLVLFPNGRLPSRRWWPVLVVAGLGVVLPSVGIGWSLWGIPTSFWDSVAHSTSRRGVPISLALAGFACFAVALLAGLVSLVVRRRRARDDAERRLLRWAAVGTAVGIGALAVELEAGAAWGAWLVVAAAFPAAMLVAILRYGLYDIDLIIHRTLLYGLLVLILYGAYAVVVLAATALVPAQAAVVGTVAVVTALAPLHRLLRRRLDHWLYGDRADPYRALTELGRRLEHHVHPDELFAEVARSVGEALRAPYVAVLINDGGRERPLATHGTSRERPRRRVWLVHGGERVGELVVEARAPEEGFSQRDVRLLDDLARQVAPVADAARLAQALAQANDRFEREQEEELRRIGDDLHDTVGPAVAGIRMQVEAARTMVGDAVPAARRQLGVVVSDLRTLGEEVRNLMRKADPVELRLGLLRAVERQARRFGHHFAVRVSADDPLDGIESRVQSAAYRIISEALTNVAKHAKAGLCLIRLERTPDLRLTVADDGCGIPEGHNPGIGLASMRKRCEDLGGTFTIESSSRGTRIVALLPLDPN